RVSKHLVDLFHDPRRAVRGIQPHTVRADQPGSSKSLFNIVAMEEEPRVLSSGVYPPDREAWIYLVNSALQLDHVAELPAVLVCEFFPDDSCRPLALKRRFLLGRDLILELHVKNRLRVHIKLRKHVLRFVFLVDAAKPV